MWPPAPEIPRYQFAGQLTGEPNFVRDEADDGALVRFFRWVVGLADTRPKTLQRPQAVAVDAAGRIFVTDVGRAAVYVFDPVAGELRILEFADGLRRFVNPIGIVSDPDGSTWVADAELGLVAHLAPGGDTLPPLGEGVLTRPTGIVQRKDNGHLIVADTHAHALFEFSPDGTLIRRLGQRGHEPGTFNYPTFLAIAGDRLYVTDTMNSRVQILRIDSGEFLDTVGRRGLYVGELVRPKGVATDIDGNVYVVESLYDNLLIYNSQGQFLMPIGGNGKEVGKFYLPSGVAVDGLNRVLVSDTFNGRVVLFQYLGNSH
ncbi:MAG: 6-bladed beta-propeller [Rhodocyclaceae bacterium]|nr:6-bladed beta-propeller [Rhodocyclaceae bacterium]